MPLRPFAILAVLLLANTMGLLAEAPPVDAKSGGPKAELEETTDEVAADKRDGRSEVQAISARAGQIFAELDKDGDGQLTADEVPADRRSFFEHVVRTGDVSKDGSLSLSEFVAGLAPLSKPGPVEADPSSEMERRRSDRESFFKRIDRNGDGKLSLDELPAPFQDRALAALEELGRGRNGTLSMDEFRQHVAAQLRPRPNDFPGSIGRPPVPAFFRRIDRNADGRLSRSELEAVSQVWDELDPDGDGSIGLEEFLGARRGELRPATPNAPAVIRPEEKSESKTEETSPDKAKKSTKVVVPATRPGTSPLARDRPGGALKRLDVDGDGRVSRDEAPANLKRNFQKLDVDGDGYLDPRELRQALEQMRRSMPKSPDA